MLSFEQVQAFERDGFVLVNNVLSAEEIRVVLDAVEKGDRPRNNARNMPDAEGRSSKLSLWTELGNDVFGAISASPRIVQRARLLLREDLYHWHSKVMLKEPRVGGAWEWHQDYGYWYSNGCLLPDMASALVAVDRATKENGCLQLLKGSHRMGRVEHGRFGEQTGADPERVNEAMKRFELVYFEAEPGDALFFHGNALHSSAPNTSPNPRWSLICCFNTKENDPYKESHHPRYTPMNKVGDDMIKKVGSKASAAADEGFLKPHEDRTTGAGKQ